MRPAPVRVEFLPDPRPLGGIAKEIRSRHLAYPLFGLARMFLERPESHRIRLSAEAIPAKEGEKPGAPSPLFQLGEDGPVALSRAALENLAFDHYRERFYYEQSVQKDPPKGNFTSVARERGSGVLLGPPNHHSYQANLRALYESRYSRRMDFEEFRRGVEIISDPALIERWKEEVRTVTTYTVRDTLPLGSPGNPDETPASEATPEPTPTEAVTGEAATPDASDAPAETQAAAAESETAPAVETAPPTEEVAATAPEAAPPGDAAASPASDAPKPVVFENLADVRTHFRQTYLDKLVRSGNRLELPGPTGRQLPEGSLTLSLRLAHEQELRYPAGLVQPLRAGLQNSGLHIFKHRKRVVYVSAVRPTPFRGGGETGGAVSEGISAILETIAAQPMISGKDLATRVVARRLGPAPAPSPAPEVATPAPEAAPVEALDPAAPPAADLEAVALGVAEPTPSPVAVTDPRQEAMDRFKAHLAADLRYLVGAGHVIAFHNGTFDLPLPPRPKDPPKPAAAKGPVAAGGTTTPPVVPVTGPAETNVESVSETGEESSSDPEDVGGEEEVSASSPETNDFVPPPVAEAVADAPSDPIEVTSEPPPENHPATAHPEEPTSV